MITLFGCHFAQPALTGFESLVYPKPRRQALGDMGEITVRGQLESAGYLVSRGRRGEGDLHVVDPLTGECWRVEIKTALRGRDRKWRFLLYKSGKTNYRCSDVVILLAVLDDFHCIPYTIPVRDLGARSQLVITSHPATYAGWLSVYRSENFLKGLVA